MFVVACSAAVEVETGPPEGIEDGLPNKGLCVANIGVEILLLPKPTTPLLLKLVMPEVKGLLIAWAGGNWLSKRPTK